MARNRKARGQVLRWRGLWVVLVLCVMAGGAGLGFVWQQDQLYRLGVEYRDLELRHETLRRQNKVLADNLAAFSAPGSLVARVRAMELDLGPALPDQVIRVGEPEAVGAARGVWPGEGREVARVGDVGEASD